ncbi:hypothetical protein FQN60_014073 [Etheostoma spectabile]|uniref:Uncharacterized protein n=1 Tax=Etheostoma spectabile TaxID=54343 RepID=A0A5J5D9H5_9PERO|nr:hypothetical protein FQN60_014073 [Etheostoma spectabile]
MCSSCLLQVSSPCELGLVHGPWLNELSQFKLGRLGHWALAHNSSLGMTSELRERGWEMQAQKPFSSKLQLPPHLLKPACWRHSVQTASVVERRGGSVNPRIPGATSMEKLECWKPPIVLHHLFPKKHDPWLDGVVQGKGRTLFQVLFPSRCSLIKERRENEIAADSNMETMNPPDKYLQIYCRVHYKGSMSPTRPETPSFAPLCPLRTRLVCMHIQKHMRVQTKGEKIQLRSLSQCFTLTLLLSALLGPNNPVCSRPCTEVSALRASTICTLSLLGSQHCGGALLEAIETDPIPTLAFCQQRLHSEKRNGSSGQTNLLLYVSCGQIEYEQIGLVSGPAEKPPPGVRSGVIYHSRLREELTFVQPFCSAISSNSIRVLKLISMVNVGFCAGLEG